MLLWTHLKRSMLAIAGVILFAEFPAVGELSAAEARTKEVAGPVADAKSQTPDAGAKTVLASRSPWRWRMTLRPPQVDPEALKAGSKDATAPVFLSSKAAFTDVKDNDTLQVAPLPGEWTGPGFEDSDWARTKLQFPGLPINAGVVALRGRFEVSDPGAVRSLSLDLGYLGGVVVFLNGKEVGRSDMPEGPLSASTPAKAYPDEVWMDTQGKALPASQYFTAEHKERAGKRYRKGSLTLPVAALRKGINVLALEIHRSDYHPIARTWWSTDEWMYGRYRGWSPVGINSLTLKAEGNGVTPNVERPSGIQVWALDVMDRLDKVNFGDPGELRPVRIVGAKNGVFSGALVVSDAQAIKGLKVAAGELARKGGAERIPASQVTVRYVGKGKVPYVPDDAIRANEKWNLDPLTDKPVPAAIMPVWVTVNVPKDSAPGDYEGKVTVSADGANTVEVPVRLSVANWTVPEPQAFRTIMNIYQSPTTLAMQYKVKEWSEEHWKLMEKSFELLAPFGDDIVNIPVVDHTQFGNDEGMIYWVKKADTSAGSGQVAYDYDFTVLDRYLKLVKKHIGVPTFVALQIWHSGGWEAKNAKQENTVTVIDPETKARTHMQVPVFATEESKKFWAPVLAAIKARLAAEGLDKSMCVGILSDGTAPPEVFKMFNEISPGIGWTRGCHSSTLATAPAYLPGDGKVICWEFCYGTGLTDPAKLLPAIWQGTGPGIFYWRHAGNDAAPLYQMRLMAERALYRKTRGVGRVCLDFWPLSKTDGGGANCANIYNRWPMSSCGQREPTMVSLAYPGPDGPQNTIRLQLMREGLQEAEAMIVIAEASKKNADRLGKELTARCLALFAERINLCRYSEVMSSPDSGGWQDRTAKVFATAAEVAAALQTAR